ncbi:MAG: hypothetical protein IJ313_11145 [Clostridia bacterium]|nr:hypothetical protein [Clostridia bacterium]
MKRMICLLLALALLGGCALAQEEMPQEVLEHIRNFYLAPQIEDYLALPGLPDGDYGFALVRENGMRELLGFRWKDGVMENWLDSSAAVPQTDRKAELFHYEDGTVIRYLWDTENEYAYVTQGDNVAVSIPDQWNETTESSVYYEWEGGAFRLRSYRNHFWDVDVFGDTYYFWDIGNGLRNVIDTDVPKDWNILTVDFDALPKRAEDVVQNASVEAVIPKAYGEDMLHAETYSFEPGQKYPVYNGPGKQYQRAGNGKASVSTNGWIQVFGEYDGFLMIQYAVGNERYRIGWIARDALPADCFVDTLPMQGGDWYTLSEDCVLTDDPLSSKASLCTLPKDALVESMASLGYAWTYVRVTIDGKTWWGFVPSELLGWG